MNKQIILYTCFITLFAVTVISQNSNRTNDPRLTTVSVPRGTPFGPQPSENSERIKYEFTISKDSAWLSLRADKYEKGVYVYEEILEEIVRKGKVYKGNEIFFEMIPDNLSDSQTMVLFTFFPNMTRFRHLECQENQKIKYKKFAVIEQSKNSFFPLLLCYVDEEQNQTEKLIEKHFKDNLISITSKEEIVEKILKNIEKCLLVYYYFSYE
jgi:hypothetical protein